MSFFTIPFNGIDYGSQEFLYPLSTSTMVPELALVTVLLGALYGVFAVLYAAPKGYLGHARKRKSIDSVKSPEPYAPTMERAVGVPAALATTAAEPTPSPVQAIYETPQPKPAPAQYTAPFHYTASFGAPSISKKPTRTYRRRTAPVRSGAASKASLKQKTEKR
ncbi:MAG: hypothetical protein ACLP9K_03855 [Nitrososphaerales archaeon]